jgi:hypothetical protein
MAKDVLNKSKLSDGYQEVLDNALNPEKKSFFAALPVNWDIAKLTLFLELINEGFYLFIWQGNTDVSYTEELAKFFFLWGLTYWLFNMGKNTPSVKSLIKIMRKYI